MRKREKYMICWRMRMNKIWSDKAWDDYLYWQTQDKKTLKRINQLINSYFAV